MSTLTHPLRLDVLLDQCARGNGGMTFYESDINAPEHLSYYRLRTEASQRAKCLLRFPGVVPGRIIMVHFRSHFENILWFWVRESPRF